MERERGPLLCVQPQGTAFCGRATARVEGIPWACPLSLGPSVSRLLQEATLDHPGPMKYWSFLCFLFLEIYRLFFFFFNNLVFYLPKASCCRH